MEKDLSVKDSWGEEINVFKKKENAPQSWKGGVGPGAGCAGRRGDVRGRGEV